MSMITNFDEFKNHLVDYDTFLCHSTRDYSSPHNMLKPGQLMFTTFISYNPVKCRVSSNKVSRIIATDVHSSTRNICFCAPADDMNEKLPVSLHGIWEESSDNDMIHWEIPIFTTFNEADAYRKKMYHALSLKRKADKEKQKKSTVTLEEIADKFNKKRKNF